MLERWYITPGRITLGISLTFFLIKSFAGSTILIKKIRISRTTAISWLIGISYWKAWVIGRTSRILKIIIGVKRVRVNVKRTKMIISIENTGKVTEEEKFPCAVFFFSKRRQWFHSLPGLQWFHSLPPWAVLPLCCHISIISTAYLAFLGNLV